MHLTQEEWKEKCFHTAAKGKGTQGRNGFITQMVAFFHGNDFETNDDILAKVVVD